LLTVDDHSRLNLAGRFVPSDTSWNHFLHFRKTSETHGTPAIICTDGLSLFGASPCGDRSDPKSQFQRVLCALGVTHLVSPAPQAKGKIERRFGTFPSDFPVHFCSVSVFYFCSAADTIFSEPCFRSTFNPDYAIGYENGGA
jgi:hypothetical protein